MKGAPIRFVAIVLGGWTCVRIAVLMPQADPLSLAEDVLAPSAAATGALRASAVGMTTPTVRPERAAASIRTHRQSRAREGVDTAVTTRSPVPVSTSAARSPEGDPPMLMPATVGSLATGTMRSRWTASAWLLARGGANGTLSGGRLGASQAGIRVTYRFDPAHRLALAARIAAPLGGRGTEAAFGIDWQPVDAPVHLVVEQRIAVDGARGGPTAMAVAGIDPTPIASGFRLEAYAQGGAILRDGRAQAFGDGAARLTRPVVVGPVALDVGAGVWGAGQSGATRLDAGPTVGVAIPVAGKRLRLSLDWRHRVAGRANPNSGPALSIGSDF